MTNPGQHEPAEGPLARFVEDLRQLRLAAGEPSYEEMAARSQQYSAASLASVVSGQIVPDLPITIAYATACRADAGWWQWRWEQLEHELYGADSANGLAPPPAGPTGPGSFASSPPAGPDPGPAPPPAWPGDRGNFASSPPIGPDPGPAQLPAAPPPSAPPDLWSAPDPTAPPTLPPFPAVPSRQGPLTGPGPAPTRRTWGRIAAVVVGLAILASGGYVADRMIATPAADGHRNPGTAPGPAAGQPATGPQPYPSPHAQAGRVGRSPLATSSTAAAHAGAGLARASSSRGRQSQSATGPSSGSTLASAPGQIGGTLASAPGQSCGSGDATWVHLYNANRGWLRCVGFKGNHRGNAVFTGFCAGNNSGTITGTNENGQTEQVTFGPAPANPVFEFSGNKTEFPGGTLDITDVTITKWSGSSTCPD